MVKDGVGIIVLLENWPPSVKLPASTSELQRQSVVAATDCPNPGSRLFVKDQITKRQFLVDSGSDLSCYLRRLLRDRRQATDYDLSAANYSTIKTFGTLQLKLNQRLQLSFPRSFIVADVSTPIIGSDFMVY